MPNKSSCSGNQFHSGIPSCWYERCQQHFRQILRQLLKVQYFHAGEMKQKIDDLKVEKFRMVFF